jgi:dihydroorotase
LRQKADRAALRAGLADGTVDVLVSDHTPVGADEKALPFSEATPGATGLELLLSLTLKWAAEAQVSLPQALGVVTHRSAELLGASARAHQASPGRLELGCQADLCVFDPAASWRVTPQALRSQGKHTLFDGYELPGRVHHTVVGGRLVFSADLGA